MESSNGESLTLDSLTLEENNEIYSKIVQPSKQGRVFGLGSMQSAISVTLEASSVSPQANEEVGMLTRQVKELETEIKRVVMRMHSSKPDSKPSKILSLTQAPVDKPSKNYGLIL